MSHLNIMARTLYGEARGEYKHTGLAGLMAVGSVILNRVRRGNFGATVTDVCLKPFQFSCWNGNDPNYALVTQKNLYGEDFLRCERVAYGLLHENWPDITEGCTHYYARYLQKKPFWAKNEQLFIGQHIFCKDP